MPQSFAHACGIAAFSMCITIEAAVPRTYCYKLHCSVERHCRTHIHTYMIDDNAFFLKPFFTFSSCSFFARLVHIGFGEMAATNSFRHPDEKLDELEALHEAQQFLNAKETELWVVNQDDDDGANRMIHNFGDVCPIPLGAGIEVCQAFQKLYRCRSCVSEKCARNYLARHAYFSSNHAGTLKDKQASFAVANTAVIIYAIETFADRKDVRAHAAAQGPQQGQELKQEPTMEPSQPAHPPPRRIRSTSGGPIGAGPRTRGRSRSRRRASSHRGHSTREVACQLPPSSPVRSQVGLAATQEIAPIARSAKVKMTAGDVRSLSNVVSRMSDSQKRMFEGLQYLMRQVEGETKVSNEAQSAIDNMVIAAELRCARRWAPNDELHESRCSQR